MGLFTIYDAFISDLLHLLLGGKPEIMNSSGRTLTLKEISQLGSIKESCNFLIDAEVEDVIRESYADQFDWMEKKFSIKLRQDLSVWPEFVELSQRRHLFVHCDGRVSRQYIDVCRANNVVWTTNKQPNPGIRLSVNRDYFLRAISVLHEIGFKLGQTLLRKVLPEKIGDANHYLDEHIYRLLSSGKWELVVTVCLFAQQLPSRQLPEAQKKAVIINLAQSYIWLGKAENALKLLNDEDWSASSDDFNLAVAVIREDYELACRIMRTIGAHGKVDEAAYRDWPLFRKFRETTEFSSAFEQVFDKSFSTSVEKAAIKNAKNAVEDLSQPF